MDKIADLAIMVNLEVIALIINVIFVRGANSSQKKEIFQMTTRRA